MQSQLFLINVIYRKLLISITILCFNLLLALEIALMIIREVNTIRVFDLNIFKLIVTMTLHTGAQSR